MTHPLSTRLRPVVILTTLATVTPLATGTSPTSYSPTRPVTRGQLAAFLARLRRTSTSAGPGH